MKSTIDSDLALSIITSGTNTAKMKRNGYLTWARELRIKRQARRSTSKQQKLLYWLQDTSNYTDSLAMI